MARGTVEFVEREEEQKNLFPELDDSPEHKAIARQAKKFAKAKAARDEMKTTAKEEQDAEEKKLIEMLHEAKLTAFKHGGMKVNILPTSEKVRVRLDDEDAEDEGE